MLPEGEFTAQRIQSNRQIGSEICLFKLDITYTYGICVSMILPTGNLLQQLQEPSSIEDLLVDVSTTSADHVKVTIGKVISALEQVPADREYVEDLYVKIEVIYTQKSQGGIEVLRFDTTGWHGSEITCVCSVYQHVNVIRVVGPRTPPIQWAGASQ